MFNNVCTCNWKFLWSCLVVCLTLAKNNDWFQYNIYRYEQFQHISRHFMSQMTFKSFLHTILYGPLITNEIKREFWAQKRLRTYLQAAACVWPHQKMFHYSFDRIWYRIWLKLAVNLLDVLRLKMKIDMKVMVVNWIVGNTKMLCSIPYATCLGLIKANHYRVCSRVCS